MDFTNRASRPVANQQVAPSHSGAGGHHDDGADKKRGGKLSLPFNNLATTLLLVSAAVVVLGLTWLLIFTQDRSQKQFVDKGRLQAVFLNGGQVYFGNITRINSEYVRLGNIYYLRVNQQVQPKQNGGGEETTQDISLVKLGCELHGPQDQMVINQEQVLFWENLKSDGQVAKAVEKYKAANPKGQDCSAQNETSTNSAN